MKNFIAIVSFALVTATTMAEDVKNCAGMAIPRKKLYCEADNEIRLGETTSAT